MTIGQSDSPHTWRVVIGQPDYTMMPQAMSAPPMIFASGLADSQIEAGPTYTPHAFLLLALTSHDVSGGTTGFDASSYLVDDWTMTEADSGRTTILEFSVYNPPSPLTEWAQITWEADYGTPGATMLFGGYITQARPEYGGMPEMVTWRCKAEGYVTRLNRTPLVRKTYVARTAAYIVNDLIQSAGLVDYDSVTHVDTGPTISIFATNGEHLAKVLQRLSDVVAGVENAPWSWRVGPEKDVWFHAAATVTAPFSVTDTASADWVNSFPAEKSPVVEIDAADIRNRITVRGGVRASDNVTDTFTGDGSTTIFQLSHKPVRKFVRTRIDGVTQRHYADFYNRTWADGYDVLVNYTAGIIRFNPSAPPAPGTTITAIYSYDTPIEASTSSMDSFTRYGFWFDYEVEDKAITSQEDADDIARALLAQYAYGIVSGQLTVRRLGLRAGQYVSVHFPEISLDGNYPIREVRYSLDKTGLFVKCDVKVGGKGTSFSSAFAGGQSTMQSQYAQTTVPRFDIEVGTMHIRNALTIGYDVDSYWTGSGIWAGMDGTTAKMRIGSLSGNYLSWDGSELHIAGTISTSLGDIGGWSIVGTELKSGTGLNKISFDSAGPSITIGANTFSTNAIGDMIISGGGDVSASQSWAFSGGVIVTGAYSYLAVDADADAQIDCRLLITSSGFLEVDGNTYLDAYLYHRGSRLGFYNATPVVQPSAYTQTYATATRTFSAYTADSESSAYTGIDNAQGGTVYAQVADLNALRVAYENLRAFAENVGKLVNSIIDDTQAIGLSA